MRALRLFLTVGAGQVVRAVLVVGADLILLHRPGNQRILTVWPPVPTEGHVTHGGIVLWRGGERERGRTAGELMRETERDEG